MRGIGPPNGGKTYAERRLTSHWSRRRRGKEGEANIAQTVGQHTAPEGYGDPPTDWRQIDWRKAERVVRSLRFRIFRRITQINEGKNTPGIDGEVITTPEERAKLTDDLRHAQPWKASPVRRVYIPKAKGKQRPIGIPTIRDRVMQAVVKEALEPRFEAAFEAQSYGFRPGRCGQDAIHEIYTALNDSAVGRNQVILDADIKGAFDHISHEFIRNRIGPMPGRTLVNQWLKAGYMEWGMLHQTMEGTPQGGVISPLLANIALDRLATHLGKGYRMARYADDFIVMAKSREAIEQALPQIEAFLQERGLELNWEKTRIVHRTEGFHFLGFTIRMFGKKLLIKPQKEKVQALLNQVRVWLKAHRAVTPEAVIQHLNPLLRGWALYYRHVVSKSTFQKIDHEIWQMLWGWTKRRHPNKGKGWIYARYFQENRHGGTFYAETRDRRGQLVRLYLNRIGRTPITRHVKVKGTHSPDDPRLTPYWEQRRVRLGRRRLARGSRFYQIAEGQRWQCLGCGNPLFNGEPIHLHHVTPVKAGGTDAVENLQWLHGACHHHRHQKREVAEAHRLEPSEGKLSCSVLRGGEDSNALALPD